MYETWKTKQKAKIHEALVEILSSSASPLTISALARMSSEKLQEHVSWNTIQKYVNELVETNKIQPISLPHSKGGEKRGLTVYTLKK